MKMRVLEHLSVDNPCLISFCPVGSARCAVIPAQAGIQLTLCVNLCNKSKNYTSRLCRLDTARPRYDELPHRYAVPPFFFADAMFCPPSPITVKFVFLITRNATARRSIFNPRVASVKIGDGEYPGVIGI